MIYLVSSVSRSGSSMMMRCLVEGGLPAKFDSSHEAYNEIYGDDGYQPNPNGFYAFNTNFRSPEFFKNYDGNLIKILLEDLLFLPSGEYTLIFMKRNPEEIRKSMHRFQDEVWGEEMILEVYEEYLAGLFTRLEKRGDFTIIVLNYADVINDPNTEFQKLIDCGINFDKQKAVEMVDPSLYRFKLESNG